MLFHQNSCAKHAMYGNLTKSKITDGLFSLQTYKKWLVSFFCYFLLSILSLSNDMCEIASPFIRLINEAILSL